jgi:hypothetical protein
MVDLRYAACISYHMYEITELGLAPEIVTFDTKAGAEQEMLFSERDAHSLLRPETAGALCCGPEFVAGVH